MLSEKMEKALNDQINAEMFSSYLYLSMAADFEDKNLKGMATWMRLQADEEREHAMKIFDFVINRGGRVSLTAIEQPQAEWDSPRVAFEAALEHERHISGLINNLSQLSYEERDHASHAFLEWFQTEQVEEEANADEIVAKLKLAEGAPGALLMVDNELGSRSTATGA